MNWVSVKDRLPEDNTYVLVACEGGKVDKSFFSFNRDFLAKTRNGSVYSRKKFGKESGYFALCHEYGYKITHWMPIPKPPENNND